MPPNPPNASANAAAAAGSGKARARGAAQAQIVCATEPLPTAFSASLFLAGGKGSWRREAVQLVDQAGFDGVILVPEPRSTPRPGTAGPERPVDVGRLLQWQDEALRHSDVLLLWLGEGGAEDAQAGELWGRWQRSARVCLGAPPGTDSALTRSAARLRIPVYPSLAETVAHALSLLHPGALRRGGERAVPLLLWRSPGFHSWYKALRGAGHRLDDAHLEWSYRSKAAGRPPLLWALRPRVFLPTEHRHKFGEVVIGRSDISATVLYYRQGLPSRLDTLVVLVREFRSAVRNQSGYGYMLPGGSAAQATEREQDARATALKEVSEETGLRLIPSQLEAIPGGSRQLLASLSCHHAHLFRAELTTAQLQELKATAAAGRPLGANPNERCYVILRSLRELQHDPDFDWSQLGMLLHALHDLP